MKILVADDSKTTLAIIKSSLQKLGHDVLAVADGKSAIEKFKLESPDLVILDVVMEGMNGLECAREIRQINPEDWIPIIFLSASVDDASIAAGILAGGDDYITKPFSDVTLEAKILAMQRISSMRKQLLLTTDTLKKLSSTDALTGLYNRFQFERSIQERMSTAERHHRHLALLFLDIDHFKSVNDGFGHHVGDALLVEVADRLRRHTRLEDFVARIGGDEFVIILSEIKNHQDAEDFAKKIVSEMSVPYDVDGHILRVSASAGIAYYPGEGVTRESIVRDADVAMYQAKESGRNSYQVFTKDMQARQLQHVSLEHELKFALDRNELYLCYQPVMNLLTKKLVGMEALLRWRHPKFGNISPDVFIPIAEETGLINEIGHWVIHSVCVQGAAWAKEGFTDIKMALNLSVHQFIEDGFIESIDAVLDETGFPAGMLELELTESTLITYTQQLKEVMTYLQERGIGIAVDDFGTRFSSITSLRYLPISTLKIDKSFMKDVMTDPKNSIIVKALIALGINLNLKVIAEGVETEDQVNFSILNNCIYAQGFIFSEPVIADEMTIYLQKNYATKTTIK